MAKKKEHKNTLNSPSGWGDFDDIEKKDPVQMGIEGLHGTAVEPAEEQKQVMASRGASAGCRPGTTRHRCSANRSQTPTEEELTNLANLVNLTTCQ